MIRTTFTACLRLGSALAIGLGMSSAIAQPASDEARSARDAAQFDLSGYWVPVITEDWRYRMATPPVGDFSGVPLNEAGQAAANAWNPEADIRAGNECRAYGVAGVMRMPTRLHITWEDDQTLRIETDAGEQTRLLHFAEGEAGEAGSWQGNSQASWEKQDQRRGFGPFPSTGPGTLKVVTTDMRPGYLRRNGVPYSEETVVSEYFVRHDDFGDAWFTVTMVVEDPVYLRRSFITSTHFRREDSDNNWNPAPCEVVPPLQ